MACTIDFEKYALEKRMEGSISDVWKKVFFNKIYNNLNKNVNNIN